MLAQWQQALRGRRACPGLLCALRCVCDAMAPRRQLALAPPRLALAAAAAPSSCAGMLHRGCGTQRQQQRS
jgi:hypothetical protein